MGTDTFQTSASRVQISHGVHMQGGTSQILDTHSFLIYNEMKYTWGTAAVHLVGAYLTRPMETNVTLPAGAEGNVLHPRDGNPALASFAYNSCDRDPSFLNTPGGGLALCLFMIFNQMSSDKT